MQSSPCKLAKNLVKLLESLIMVSTLELSRAKLTFNFLQPGLTKIPFSFLQVLRLVCLQCFVNNGFKLKLFNYYKQEIIQVWDHSFSAYAKFSEKLTFPTP